MLDQTPVKTLADYVEIARMAAERSERQGPLDCEIPENSTANWYLVHTFPNEEMRALRWLAKRKFGAFRPMQQRRDRINGVALDGLEAVFPGWLFVFVWDMRRMRSRILRSPGVQSIFQSPTSLAPIPISDDFVQKIRALSFQFEETNRRHLTNHKYAKTKHTGKQRRSLARLKKTLKRQGMWDSSVASSISGLEPHRRIALLKRVVTNGAAFRACPL